MQAGDDAKSRLRWVTLVLCAASLWLCSPLWPPLLLAAWTAALLRPVMTRIERRLHGRRAGAAVLTSLVGFLAATPLVLVAVGVIVGARDLAGAIAGARSAEALLEHIAIGGEQSAQGLHMPRTFGDGLALAQTYGREAFALLADLAGAAATAVLMLVVYFGATFALMRRGAGQGDWIISLIPLRRDHIERFTSAFEETGRGLFIGVGLTCAVQGAIALITYLALGVPQAWVLGPVTGIAAVIPVVGSALIWGPIALGLLLADHPIKAGVLLLIGLAVIGTVDNLLRPVFARLGMLRLPMVVLFVSAVGGLLVLGPWGAVLGPLVVRLTLEGLNIQRAEAAELRTPEKAPSSQGCTPGSADPSGAA